VIGPASDGGYVLIGANKIDRSIFENITWSSKEVLKQTDKKINALNWKCSYLDQRKDLDGLDDFRYFSAQKKYQKLFLDLGIHID